MGSLFGGSTSRLYTQQQAIQNQMYAAQQQAYEGEAALLDQEGDLAYQDAQLAMEQKIREGKSVAADQAVAYLNSGVTLDGTPLDVIGRTIELTRQEAVAIGTQGARRQALYRGRAAQTRSAGRASILGQRYTAGVDQAQTEMAANRAFGSAAYNLIGQGVLRGGAPLVSNLWGALKSYF